MKSPFISQAFLLLTLVGVASADIPRKAPPGKYNSLATNSPFTSRPNIEPIKPINRLDDYALLGVSPIGGTGYRVTLINKKKPDDRITVDSGSTKTNFKILEVIRKPGYPQGTVVRMQSGNDTGTVSFDQKLLAIAAPPAAPKNPPGHPGKPPQLGNGQQPPMPGGGPPQRQPRPRVVQPQIPAPAPGG